jgi:hypothetical protein
LVELIDYDSSHYGSHNDIWVDGDGNDFSMGGDSGSLYLERTNPDGNTWRRVVGIHWGGAGNDGVGHPIRAVFDNLDLTTICSGFFSQLFASVFETETQAATGADDLNAAMRDVLRLADRAQGRTIGQIMA